ncbi:MAG: LysR family transcriptional regulator [Methylococcales bacterium]|nr:LysR family transcriptional regulator [Methylococcales bacterium]
MEIFKNMSLFVEIAKVSSFSRAAAILGLPNSTVSRRIADLEREMGLRLFKRTTRRVELTESGHLYFKHCMRLLQEAQFAYEEVANIQANPIGVIRVSMPGDLAVIYLIDMFAEFTMLYPNLQFVFDLTPKHDDMVSEAVDVAIRIGPSKDQNLIARPLASFSVGLYASPDYLKLRGEPKHPQDLLQHDCLRITENPWVLNNGKEFCTLNVTGKFVANNPGMLRGLALKGTGIFPATQKLVEADINENKLIRVLPKWSTAPVTVYAMTETRLVSAKVRVLLDFLSDHFSKIY